MTPVTEASTKTAAAAAAAGWQKYSAGVDCLPQHRSNQHASNTGARRSPATSEANGALDLYAQRRSLNATKFLKLQVRPTWGQEHVDHDVVQVRGLCTEPLVDDGNAQVAKQGVEENHLQTPNRAAHSNTTTSTTTVTAYQHSSAALARAWVQASTKRTRRVPQT
jgi:hypothetical protein